MSHLRGRGRPPPAKTVDFFQKKFRKYSACPEKPFKLTPFVFIVTHSLGTGSNEIFIKKNRLFSERGGGSIIILLLLPFSYIAVEGKPYQISGFLSKLEIKGTKSPFRVHYRGSLPGIALLKRSNGFFFAKKLRQFRVI